MSGFIAMRRDWQEHPVFGNDEFSRRDAWAWLIANAAWKPIKVRVKGSIVDLERGELCFAQRFLAEKWGWSKSKVDRFLHLLRSEGMIATRSKTGATAGHPAGQGQAIITICNYDKFQTPLKGERGNAEMQTGATAGQQRGKEEQENKIIPFSNENGASDFWSFAVGYLGEKRRPLIGRWCKDYTQIEAAKAITAAQLANAAEPVSYIEATLRKASRSATAGEIW